MARRRLNFRTRLRRNRLWMRVAAAAGDRRFWGFLRIRKQHIIAEQAQFKKRSERLTLRDRLARIAGFLKKKEPKDGDASGS